MVRYCGGKTYLRAKVGGKVVRKSLGTADVRIAKIKRDAELEKLRAAVESGGAGDAGMPATVGEALELVGKRVVNAAGLKLKTVRYYRQLFQTLRGTLPLDAVGHRGAPTGWRPGGRITRVTHNEKEKRHWAEMENFGRRRIAINGNHYCGNLRLLEGGLWCEVGVGYNYTAGEDEDDYWCCATAARRLPRQ